MPNALTYDDITNINYAYYKLKQTRPEFAIFNSEIAKLTGWSISTVRKYLDKNWIPDEENSEFCKNDDHMPGVYLMAQQVQKNNHLLNLVKVGKSTNLNKRNKQYKTENPTAERIAVMFCADDYLNDYETFFHNVLKNIGKQIDKTEWYSVSLEDFNNIKNTPFSELDWSSMYSNRNKNV